MVQANEADVAQAALPIEGGETPAPAPSPSQDSPSGIDAIRRGIEATTPGDKGTSEEERADKPEGDGEKPAAETRTYTQEELDAAVAERGRQLQSQADKNVEARTREIQSQATHERQVAALHAELMDIRENDPEEWARITKDPEVMEFLGNIARSETQQMRVQLERQIGSEHFSKGQMQILHNLIPALNQQPEFKDWKVEDFEKNDLWVARPENGEYTVQDFNTWINKLINHVAEHRAEPLAEKRALEIAKANNREFMARVNGSVLADSVPPSGNGSGYTGPDSGASPMDLIKAGLAGKKG